MFELTPELRDRINVFERWTVNCSICGYLTTEEFRLDAELAGMAHLFERSATPTIVDPLCVTQPYIHHVVKVRPFTEIQVRR